MLLRIYKLGSNPLFNLRYYESSINDETYNFSEINDLQLNKDYIKDNKKILSLNIDDQEHFLYLNDIYQANIIIDDSNSENIKRNNRHSYIMLIFPNSDFPGNNYDKLKLTINCSNTEIDLTKNNEWIGILIPINTQYSISFKNDTDVKLVLKMILNRNNGVRELKFDIDSFIEVNADEYEDIGTNHYTSFYGGGYDY